jgi:hypothetical protein
MQHRRALLVTATNGMHQRGSERRQRARQQRRVADAPCLRTRLPQARHTGLDRAGIDGRAPRVELAHRRRPVTAYRRPLLGSFVGRSEDPRIGRTPQLAAEQHLAGVDMLMRGADLARPHKAPHQQLMGAVIEPVQRERPRRQRRAFKRCIAR